MLGDAVVSDSVFARIVVPVADPEDARATAEALGAADLPDGGTARVVYVVEKAGGAPDKASVEQRELYAAELFEAFQEEFDPDGFTVETEIRYGTDIAETVVSAAQELDATAIVFKARGGSRWVKLLTGDVASELVSNSEIPVVTLPEAGGETDG
jgi:nucleotide-binding universal stress UspA family protein